MIERSLLITERPENEDCNLSATDDRAKLQLCDFIRNGLPQGNSEMLIGWIWSLEVLCVCMYRGTAVELSLKKGRASLLGKIESGILEIKT